MVVATYLWRKASPSARESGGFIYLGVMEKNLTRRAAAKAAPRQAQLLSMPKPYRITVTVSTHIFRL
jgi:hypothetical protein